MLKKRHQARRFISRARLDLWLCLMLTVLTIGVYFQVRNHDFISMDDHRYVLENQHILHGVNPDSIKWAFFSRYAGNWHPLTWLSHMLDVQLYGLNPGGHHLMNVLLHTINGLLLFWVLHRMTGAMRKSVFVAALFALHPLHVESVAWVSERKDVLSTFFWLLTMGAYFTYVKKRKWIYYVLSLFCFICGLMAKPMMVTLPFVLILIDIWPFRRISPIPTPRFENWRRILIRLIVEKAPFFFLSVACSIITYHAQKNLGAIATVDIVPLTLRIENAVLSYFSYLIKMLWPMHLGVYYPYFFQTPFVKILVASGMLILISIGVVHYARRCTYLLTGWLWYLGTLVPVIGLVQVGNQAMADRYTYVPLIGIFIMLTWGADDLFGKFKRKSAYLCLFGVVIVCLSTAATFRQVGYWKNSSTLYKHTLSSTGGNQRIHLLLGNAMIHDGNFREGVYHLKTGVKIDPSDLGAVNYLGYGLLKAGYIREALTCFYEIRKLNPNSKTLYVDIGSALMAAGDTESAISEFQNAIRNYPDYAEAHNSLGLALFRQGSLKEAQHHFRMAVKNKIHFDIARSNLRITSDFIHHIDNAVANLDRALYNVNENQNDSGEMRKLKKRYKELMNVLRDYRKSMEKLGGFKDDQIQLENMPHVLNILERYMQITRTKR